MRVCGGIRDAGGQGKGLRFERHAWTLRGGRCFVSEWGGFKEEVAVTALEGIATSQTLAEDCQDKLSLCLR